MDKLTKKEKKEQNKFEYEEKIRIEKRNNLIKKITIWSSVAIVTILSIWGLAYLANQPKYVSSAVAPVVQKDDIALGNRNSKVVLLEYADFQCPACATSHAMVKQLLAEFDGKILYVFRTFPLPQHKNAKVAAYSGYAAHLQNKFLQMQDILYGNQTEWSELTDPSGKFEEYAKKLNLNIDKYKKDIALEDVRKIISNQENEAVSLGINATPTFFVNYRQIETPRNYEDFKKYIKDELSKK